MAQGEPPRSGGKKRTQQSPENARVHRWPFGQIDGPGKWSKPHLNQGPLFSRPTKKDTYGRVSSVPLNNHKGRPSSSIPSHLKTWQAVPFLLSLRVAASPVFGARMSPATNDPNEGALSWASLCLVAAWGGCNPHQKPWSLLGRFRKSNKPNSRPHEKGNNCHDWLSS